MNAGLMSGAIALAIGIGIQNYPEGTAVALPLIGDGMSKKKAFLIGSMSAIVAAGIRCYGCRSFKLYTTGAASSSCACGRNDDLRCCRRADTSGSYE